MAVALAAVVVSFIPPAAGLDKIYHLAGYDVTLIVQRDGTLRISERIAFSFDQGTFTTGYRDIPWRGFDDIVGISVTDGSGTRIPFTLTFRPELSGDWHIEWSFPPTTGPVVQTFGVSYVVTNALQQPFPEENLLDWQAVGSGWTVGMDRVDVNVTLDFPVDPTRVSFSPVPARTISTPDSLSALYAGSGLPPHTGFRTVVGFPAGASVTYGPMRIARESPWTTGLLAFLVVFAIMCLVWVVRGREPWIRGMSVAVTNPPSDRTPEEVAYLLTQRLWMPGALGGLFRLAKRGYLQFHGALSGPEAPAESPVRPVELTPSGKRVLLEDPAADPNLPFHERLLLSAVAADEEDPLMQVGRSLPTIEAEVSRRLASAGLLVEDPQTVRRRYLQVAFVVFSVGLFLAVSALFLPITFSLRGILLGICLSAIPIGVVARYMPRLTRKGAEERRRWVSFLASLREQIESSGRPPVDSVRTLDEFMEYTPLIPGIDFRTWVSRLGTRFAGVPYLPTWFVWYGPSTSRESPEFAAVVDRGLPSVNLGQAVSADFGRFAEALATNLRISKKGGTGSSEGTGMGGWFSDSGGGGFGGGGSGGGGGGGGGGAR